MIDLIINAIHLLSLENWPEDSDLVHLPLPEIQLLVLVVLPAPNIDNATMYIPWCRALIRCMGADQPYYHFRRTAIVIAEEAREDLATFTGAASENVSLRELVLSELSPALLTAMSPADGAENDDNVHSYRDFCYIRLISTLAMNSYWHAPLIADRHIEKCITLLGARRHVFPLACLHLANIFLCIAPPGQAVSCCDAITNAQWWELTRGAWNAVEFCNNSDIEALVTISRATEMHIPQDLSNGDLKSFEESLSNSVYWLRELPGAEGSVISAAMRLRDMVHRKRRERVEDSPVPEQLELGEYYTSLRERANSSVSSSETFAVRRGSSGARQVVMPPRGFESVFDHTRAYVPLGFVPFSFVPFSDDADSTSTTLQD